MRHFFDDSERGYGQASYLRLVDNHGKIRCTLLTGKSRVATIRYVGTNCSYSLSEDPKDAPQGEKCRTDSKHGRILLDRQSSCAQIPKK